MKTFLKIILYIVGALIMLSIIGTCVGSLFSGPSKTLTEAEKIELNQKNEERRQKKDAALNARILVKRKLKSPSTAEFPPTSTAKVEKTANGTWIVTSYVDSQNGFGAMVRKTWVAEIKYHPNDKIELVNIHFQ